MAIHFSPPDIREEDIGAVVDVLRSGWITSGPVVRQFEKALAAYVGVEHVVALNSCTAALEMALRLLKIGPGDQVIVPAYTYSASASVVTHVGAELVLVDTQPMCFAPSIDQILEAVTENTKAIVVVDLGGVPYDATELRRRLDERACDEETGPRPAVIVDGAHSLGARRHGIAAGGLGDYTAFSFHAVKNLTTAEGGALTWRSDLPGDSAARAAEVRRLSLHGQTKDALAKSEAGAWEYDIVEPAYKANMPDILAALGVSQLRRYPEMLERRRELVRLYRRHLDPSISMLDHFGDDFESSAHLLLVDLGEASARRERIVAALARAGISTNVHYKPLPRLTAYKRMGFDIGQYPNADRQYARVLSLPLHTHLTDEDVETVASALNRVVAAAVAEDGVE